VIRGNRLQYVYLVWAAVFIVIPLFLVIFYSVTDSGHIIRLSGEAYRRLIDPLYLKVFWRSLLLAVEATLLCLALGYPAAYFMTRISARHRNFFLMLFIIPMWINFLLRTYAWISILGRNGILNRLLGVFHLPPLELIYTPAAVLIGMVYNFLPYMVLPLFNTLSQIPKPILEAARDLGADSGRVFTRVILPLSVPGIITGVTMVFLPAVSTFVISALLGGGQFMLIGNLVEQQFLSVGDWHFGSAIAMVMMAVIFLFMALVNRSDPEAEKEGRNIW
jgi:spermidine/putrescine transport system permease protein